MASALLITTVAMALWLWTPDSPVDSQMPLWVATVAQTFLLAFAIAVAYPDA